MMAILHTDGGCSPNPGPGGWAYVLERNGTQKERSGSDPATTNNRMELTAVIRGLEATEEGEAVELVADSEYVLKGLGEWMVNWKANDWTRKVKGKRKPVLNVELWQRLDELASARSMTYTWVRGHTGAPLNERCDRMVNAIHEAFKRGDPIAE